MAGSGSEGVNDTFPGETIGGMKNVVEFGLAAPTVDDMDGVVATKPNSTRRSKLARSAHVVAQCVESIDQA
jgi:hypothetical protein